MSKSRPRWSEIKDEDPPVWRCAGLARFAGLRHKEIMACRGAWIVERKKGWCVVLKYRPEEQFWTKGGRTHYASILNAELLAVLREVQAEDFVVVPPPTTSVYSRDWWFKEKP